MYTERAAETRYKKSVRPAPQTPAGTGLRVLKAGDGNAKIGRALTKGRWRGMRLFTLTLEERATCWSGCQNWNRCYGDNMPFAHRYAPGPELEHAIAADLAVLATSKHTHAGFVVRLHVLGDFYSPEYVEFWQRMLDAVPSLRVWGYTHWRFASPIGDAVTAFALRNPERVSILRSDPDELGDPLAAAHTIAPGQAAKPHTVICPEQSGRSLSCGTCGLCFNGQTSVSFIDHSRTAMTDVRRLAVLTA